MSQFVQVLEHDVSPWPVATLGDGLLENVQPGFACGNHNSVGKGIVHVRPYNVTTDGRMDFSTLKFIPISEVTKPERLLSQGDVVFNNTNSPELVGKTAFYADSEERAFSNHMTRIRVNQDKISPEYLALALHQLWREGYFADKCNNHVSQASISRTVLLETEIALPPLSEQDRLVEALAATQETVDRARDRLATIPALLKKFRQSVLAAACSGQLTADWREESGITAPPDLTRLVKQKGKKAAEQPADLELPDIPDCYAQASIGEIVNLIQYGTSSKSGDFAPGRIPVLRMGNIQDGTLDWADLKYADQNKEISSLLLVEGDILFNRTNSPDLVGKTAVFKGEQQATFASYLIRLRAHPEFAVPEFVAYWINSSWGREWAQLVKTDGVSQSNINGTKLSAMPIPLPSVTEQAEIVRRVESLFALADSIESRLAEATAQVERTTQAILAKAFRGELTSEVAS